MIIHYNDLTTGELCKLWEYNEPGVYTKDIPTEITQLQTQVEKQTSHLLSLINSCKNSGRDTI